MPIDYRKIIFIAILLLILGVGGFLLYRYITTPVAVSVPPATTTTPPVTQVPPTQIISGPFKPVALTCTKDEGIRYQEGDFVNDPSVIWLDDGRYRVYYDIIPYVIKSAISSDGMNFTSEGIQKQGLPDTDEVYVGSPVVVKIDTRWIMYYQGSATKPNSSTRYKIFVATSGSGLNFSGRGVIMDDQASTFGAKNPKAIILPGGQVRIYYLTSKGVKTALSNDGINFTSENDPIITGTTGISVFEYQKDHYIALCATVPSSNPSLETIRTLNAQNSVDFAPQNCVQGSLAIKTGTPFDFWGVQAPSVLKLGDIIKVFYQGFNVEPKLGGGSVIVSATCKAR